MTKYKTLEEIYNGEWFAVEGKYTDSISTLDIINNPSHFSFWLKKDCYFPCGLEKFNLEFLGKWRSIDIDHKDYRDYVFEDWIKDRFDE